MTERDFSVRTRRTTRIALRIAARISVRDAFGSPEMFTAWTVVVNKHGARFKCKRPFEVLKEVGITNLATGKSGTGKIIWASTHPDRDGNYEFAVGLDDPVNLWQINYPPQDWERINSGENASDLEEDEQEAADEPGDFPVQQPNSQSEPPQQDRGFEMYSEEDDSGSAEDLIPDDDSSTPNGNGKNPAAATSLPYGAPGTLAAETLSSPTSDQTPAPPSQNVGSSQPAPQISLPVSQDLLPSGLQPAELPAAPIPTPRYANTVPEPVRQVKEPESRGKSTVAPTDRLTELLKELAESAVHSNLRMESERLFQDIKRRLAEEQDAALHNLMEQSNALLGSQEAIIEERAAEIKNTGETAVADALRQITAAAKRQSQNVEQDAQAAILASLENLRKRVAQELSTLEEQSRKHLRSDAERLLSASLETARITLSGQIDKVAEKLAQREAALFQSVEELERRTAQRLEQITRSLETQIAESAKSLIGGFAQQVLAGLNKTQQDMLAQAESKIGSASEQSLAEVRNGLARSLRDVAAAMAGNPPEEREE